MDMGVPSLFDPLVNRVIDTAGSADPLARLDAAVVVAAEAAGAGDRLLDHFVAQARPADAEPNSRLRACLDRAGEVARTDGAAEIGTHQLLAGLLAEGVAAAIR